MEKPNPLKCPGASKFLALNRDLIWTGMRFTVGSLLLLLVLLTGALRGTVKVNNSRLVTQGSADRRLASALAPKPRVDPNLITLPVVDGGDIRFKHLPTIDGPSQTRVSQIVQDDLGFIWFGTQQGLNRYDGYRFKVFTHDPADPSSLGGVFVYSLFKDRSGVIWVGTDQSLDRLEPATESITHFHLDRTDPFVAQIRQDHAGILWMATANGLYRFDPANQKIAHFRHEAGDSLSLSSDDIQSTGEDRLGQFWVLTGAGLDEFDRTSGHVTRHVQMPEVLPSGSGCNPTCRSFHVDRFGVFWIIYISGNGLAVFDPETEKLTRYCFYKQKPSDTALTGVYALLEDHDGTMWFGTMGDGLLKFDRDQKRFIRYTRHLGSLDSLAENRVIALFEDHEGNVWTGFHASVPDSFANTGPRFESFSPSSADPNGPGENLVSAIYEDKRNSLWMGAGGVLYRVNRKSGQYTRYYSAGPGASTEVVTIGQDRSGNLWVGTWGDGLSRLDPATGKFQTYHHNPADPSSLSNDSVTRIFMDHTGAMWLSTFDGLNRFDPVTERFIVYKQDRNKIEPYYSITEDNKGFFWVGGNSGLVRFLPSAGQFKVFHHKVGQSNSLSDDTVDSTLQDRSGTLWIGTQNGLNKMDPQSEVFSAYYVKNGLPGNAVSCILADEQDNLWMSTNRGLSKFDPRTQVFQNYSFADGLPGNDLTGWDACYKSPTGEMFFGGFAGGIAFRPDQISDNAYTPRVVLTDFRLASGTVQVGPSSPLKKSITEAKDVTLTHNQHFFSIEFSALSFRSPTTNRYRYKMDPLDSDWHEVGSQQRVVSYDALPAGVYEFRVEGATSRGAWSEPGVALRVEILPPWWATWWFRTTCAIAAAAVLWALFLLRLRQLAREFNAGLEARVNERTRIARELHDTLLQSFQGLMLRFQAAYKLFDTRPAEAKLTLESAIDEATQAITEGRDAVQGLRSSVVENNDLAPAIKSMGEELALGTNQNSVVLRVDVAGTPRNLNPIARDEVYQIAAEALRNAFRHAQAQRIEVDIQYDDRQFRLRVRDDGKGFDPKARSGTVRPGHYGLNGMSERAKVVDGELEVWSEVASGTEVELRIPASKVYSKSSIGGRWPLSAIFSRKSTEIKL